MSDKDMRDAFGMSHLSAFVVLNDFISKKNSTEEIRNEHIIL